LICALAAAALFACDSVVDSPGALAGSGGNRADSGELLDRRADAGAGGFGGGEGYACPAEGSAFLVDRKTRLARITVTPWQTDRWCAEASDCAQHERCFLVAPRRGLCAPPEGVDCDAYAPYVYRSVAEMVSSRPSGAGAGTGGRAAVDEDGGVDGAAGVSAGHGCDPGNRCYYKRCEGFLTIGDGICDRALCLMNGCTSTNDCAAGEVCIPGWVGAATANQCKPAGCTRDADCADSPCGKCVFKRETSWPFNSNPDVVYAGASCL
jgi:hypothetical protein